MSAIPVFRTTPPALGEAATVHSVACTMRIDFAGSGNRSSFSRVQGLTDGRYRQERATCVVVFDGTTLWMTPKTHGPVVRSGPQPNVLSDMLDPATFLESRIVSTRPVTHAGRASLAIEARSSEDAAGSRTEMIVDLETGIAVYWHDELTGRQVSMAEIEWDPVLDEFLFHADHEAARTVVEVRLI